MIINFHPKEIESKKGAAIIASLNTEGAHEVVHASDKTAQEWQAIIKSDEQLILVAPVYWWGPGYEFDKWAQNVLGYGFAYEYQNNMPVGLLAKRPFAFHLTHGTPAAYAETMRANIKERLEKGIFGFCDADVAINFYDLA